MEKHDRVPVAPPRRKKKKNYYPISISPSQIASEAGSPLKLVESSKESTRSATPTESPSRSACSRVTGAIEGSAKVSSVQTESVVTPNQPKAALSDACQKVENHPVASRRPPVLKRTLSAPRPAPLPRVGAKRADPSSGSSVGGVRLIDSRDPTLCSRSKTNVNATDQPIRNRLANDVSHVQVDITISNSKLAQNDAGTLLSTLKHTPLKEKKSNVQAIPLKHTPLKEKKSNVQAIPSYCTGPRKPKDKKGQPRTSGGNGNITNGNTPKSVSKLSSEASVNGRKTPNSYMNVNPPHRPLLSSKSNSHHSQPSKVNVKNPSSPVNLKSKVTSNNLTSPLPPKELNGLTKRDCHDSSPASNATSTQQTSPTVKKNCSITRPTIRPTRPAPPPPHLIAHYTKHKPSTKEDDHESSNYSYVSVTPRYILHKQQSETGSVTSLDLQVSPEKHAGYDSLSSVGLHSPACLEEDTYMSLLKTTLLGTKDAIYTTPELVDHTPKTLVVQENRDSQADSVNDTNDYETDELVEYVIPDDARSPLSFDADRFVEGVIYMPLSRDTLEEAPIYQDTTLLQDYK